MAVDFDSILIEKSEREKNIMSILMLNLMSMLTLIVKKKILLN